MKKLTLGFIGTLSFIALSAFAATSVLPGWQGGTGFGSTTSSNVGKFLQVSSTTPVLRYTFAPVSSGTATTTINGITGPTFTFLAGSGLTIATSGITITYTNSAPNFNTTTSINGLTGAITGLNIYNTTTTLTASSGITLFQNGQTYSILNSAPNFNTTTSINGLTGAITGLNIYNTTTSLNGLTGAITGLNIYNTTTTVQGLSGAILFASTTGFNFSTSSQTITFRNEGVQSITAGSGITINNATGSVTITNSFPNNNSTTTLNGLTGSINIRGTPQQINVATSSGIITLSTPQNINTTSSPTFASATLSNFTAGSVIFATSGGALAQNNANLFWDNANLRFLMATSGPQILGSLQIDGGNNVNAIFAHDSTGNVAIKGQSDSALGIGIRGIANDVAAIGIIADNNVSGGTALQVNGVSTYSATSTHSGNLIINGTNRLGIGTSTPIGQIDVFNSGFSMPDAFVIDNTGNIGIGTKTPNATIDAARNAATNFNITTYSGNKSAVFNVRRAEGTLAAPSGVQNGDSIGSLSFVGYDGSSFGGGASILSTATENYSSSSLAKSGDLALQTTSIGGNAPTTRLYITATGTVGIANTNPIETLSVSGHIAQTGTVDTVSACGTSPSISGKDGIGTVTEGTTATGCTVTFGTAFKLSTTCVVSSDSGLGLTFTKSSTTLVITNVGALSGTSIDYICMSHG